MIVGNPSENSTIERITIKGYVALQRGTADVQGVFLNPLSRTNRKVQHRTCQCTSLEFPHLLLLTFKMTTRGNFTPVRHPVFLSSSRIKKKKRKINFRFVQAIESISIILGLLFVASRLDRKKKKKEKKKYEFLIRPSKKKIANCAHFCRIAGD